MQNDNANMNVTGDFSNPSGKSYLSGGKITLGGNYDVCYDSYGTTIVIDINEKTNIKTRGYDITGISAPNGIITISLPEDNKYTNIMTIPENLTVEAESVKIIEGYSNYSDTNSYLENNSKLNITGDFISSGDSNDVRITDNSGINVGGNAAFASITSNGEIYVDGDLTLYGASVFNGNVYTKGDCIISGNYSNGTTVNGIMNVDGNMCWVQKVKAIVQA